jgi:signal transduction histidine kinase
MLAIVLIPTVALLVIGVGGSAYLVKDGYDAQEWATFLRDTGPGDRFAELAAEERRLSLLKLGGDESVTPKLQLVRAEFSQFLTQVDSMSSAIANLNPEVVSKSRGAFQQIFGKLPQIRKGVDTGQATSLDVYGYYSQMAGLIGFTLPGIARTAPDSEAAVELSTSASLFDIAEAMSRAHSLAIGRVAAGGLSVEEYQEFSRQVGRYHTDLEAAAPLLTPEEQQRFGQLSQSAEWKQLVGVESALLLRGPVTSPDQRDNQPLPMNLAEWQRAASEVNNSLQQLYSTHHDYGETLAANAGKETFRNSLIGGSAVLLITIIAAFIAARLSNGVVKRMKRLRAQTLELADKRLPQMVLALRSGEKIDVVREVPPLRYGTDELGQVAQAFNKAQRTAVAAAAQEAEIQNGVKSVFLNIAHRSQVVVRRQLEVLDQVEREQEDPEALEWLFQLDHLATRARRNAENLIILGGEQPGRQWRNPQPLRDVARSAIGETEHYRRVTMGRLPDSAIVGSAVADLIHLLAELIDNATAFSPPDSRVEVRGNRVGKGIVIEIEDQGLGIPRDEREEINTFLQDPPDFGIMSLSEEARLGLFVVSQLSARHGISVTLVDSAYGGIRAIVLVRSALLAPWESSSGPTSSSTRSVPGSMPGATTGASLPAPRSAMSAIQPFSTGSTTGPVVPTQGRHSWPNDLETPDFPANASLAGPPPISWPGQGVANGLSAPQPPTNGDSHAPGQATSPLADGAQNPGDGRPPPLPRRRRQANISPQLARDLHSSEGTESIRPDDSDPSVSAERARSRMSAFQRGTREGRSGKT